MGKLLACLVDHRRTLARIMIGVLALLVVLDLLTPAKYHRFPWDGIGGFGAVYGFVACVVIVVVSKALGYALLYRKEDYYDEDARDG